jgi:hypothetical protein
MQDEPDKTMFQEAWQPAGISKLPFLITVLPGMRVSGYDPVSSSTQIDDVL